MFTPTSWSHNVTNEILASLSNITDKFCEMYCHTEFSSNFLHKEMLPVYGNILLSDIKIDRTFRISKSALLAKPLAISTVIHLSWTLNR